MPENNKKALIIGCGIAGPVLAMAFQKCGINSTIYESQETPADHAGLFLYLGPNGVNVLKTLNIEKKVRENGHPCNNFVFEKHNGSTTAKMSTTDYEKKFGVNGIIIKRGILQKILREQTESCGVKIEWNKKLKNITNDNNNTITAYFEDGSTAQGNCIIGCDGIYSRTRRIMIPEGPVPKYSGHVATGAITPNQTKNPRNELTFHFGKKAYMIYFVTSNGDAMWGAHLKIDEKSLPKIKSIPSEKWKQRVSDLYDEDTSCIIDFIKNENNITTFPLYDIESLPTWHKGLICLVGDSAHATTPHAGQGASIAMESAIMLAKCMRDIPNIQNAFATYQQLRKNRVEKMIAMARRSGNLFTITNPIGKLMRNLMLSIMMRPNSKKFDDIYGYKLDWDKKISA